MFENAMLQAILSSYGEDIIKEKGDKYKDLFYKIFPNANSEAFDDFKKDLEKVLAKEKEKASNASEDEEKISQDNNPICNCNPFGRLFGPILDMSKPTANGRIFSQEVIAKAITESAKKPQFISEREKEYKDAIKKAQEAAKEYKAMKDKENPVVYIPVVYELALSVSGMIDDDFEASTNILGVFTDLKIAERQCETDINCNDDDWKEMKDLPYSRSLDLVRKVYKSKYFFDHDLMVLTIKSRVVLEMRLNDFRKNLVLSSDHLIDQDDMLLDLFNSFKADYNKLLIDFENNIDNLLGEHESECECCKNKGEEECRP